MEAVNRFHIPSTYTQTRKHSKPVENFRHISTQLCKTLLKIQFRLFYEIPQFVNIFFRGKSRGAIVEVFDAFVEDLDAIFDVVDAVVERLEESLVEAADSTSGFAGSLMRQLNDVRIAVVGTTEDLKTRKKDRILLLEIGYYFLRSDIAFRDGERK